MKKIKTFLAVTASLAVGIAGATKYKEKESKKLSLPTRYNSKEFSFNFDGDDKVEKYSFIFIEPITKTVKTKYKGISLPTKKYNLINGIYDCHLMFPKDSVAKYINGNIKHPSDTFHLILPCIVKEDKVYFDFEY